MVACLHHWFFLNGPNVDKYWDDFKRLGEPNIDVLQRPKLAMSIQSLQSPWKFFSDRHFFAYLHSKRREELQSNDHFQREYESAPLVNPSVMAFQGCSTLHEFRRSLLNPRPRDCSHQEQVYSNQHVQQSSDRAIVTEYPLAEDSRTAYDNPNRGTMGWKDYCLIL